MNSNSLVTLILAVLNKNEITELNKVNLIRAVLATYLRYCEIDSDDS